MARYIDADKLTDKLEEIQFNAPVMVPVMKIYNVIELVEDTPTADVVEVVRCGKCIYANSDGTICHYDVGRDVKPDHYCGYGERKCDNE